MNVIALGDTPHGRPAAALFDFDGTLSTLRTGWEGVMAPVMLEALMQAPASSGLDLEEHTARYIHENTGIRTIIQMEWLAVEVRRLGGEPLTPLEYKRIYLDRLMTVVRGRLAAIAAGEAAPDDFLIAGARDFITALASMNVVLYVASGTDEPDVRREVEALGLHGFFSGGVFGARDAERSFDKDTVIRQILRETGASGAGLVVFGDGPVEIRCGREAGARTIGVASLETTRGGWDMDKVRRLRSAGAHALIGDFLEPRPLLEMLS
ncbi:MAG TPA: HAD family hydrolase [Planctomycetes bacterium]|nr:HAD family hydrolase [Planctomycetota bacterium]